MQLKNELRVRVISISSIPRLYDLDSILYTPSAAYSDWIDRRIPFHPKISRTEASSHRRNLGGGIVDDQHKTKQYIFPLLTTELSSFSNFFMLYWLNFSRLLVGNRHLIFPAVNLIDADQPGISVVH